MEEVEEATLLVATAGSAAPVRQALAYAEPSAVVLIGSEQSWANLATASLPANVKKITLANAENFLEIVEVCRRELAPFVHEWLRSNRGGRLIADFTGGTRPMSAALTLIARRWPVVQFQYISGQRVPGGAMLVLDHTELAVYSPNPWDALGYQAAEEAITLFDGGSPAAAFHYLLEPIHRASAGETKEALQLLAWLIDGYAAWDRFEHEESQRLFTIVSENAERLGPLFSAASIEELRRRLTEHRAYLDLLRSASGLTRELVLDLLANAVRRMHEQRFDDAVARLYRACEALGQLRLVQQYQIKDFRSAPVALFKGEVPAQLRGGVKGDRVRLGGLQDIYTFLHGVGDPLGVAFKAAGLADGEQNPLTARNRSILAHGLRPLGQRDAKLLLDKVLPLANVQRANLPLFPKMSGLS